MLILPLVIVRVGDCLIAELREEVAEGEGRGHGGGREGDGGRRRTPACYSRRGGGMGRGRGRSYRPTTLLLLLLGRAGHAAGPSIGEGVHISTWATEAVSHASAHTTAGGHIAGRHWLCLEPRIQIRQTPALAFLTLLLLLPLLSLFLLLLLPQLVLLLLLPQLVPAATTVKHAPTLVRPGTVSGGRGHATAQRACTERGHQGVTHLLLRLLLLRPPSPR